MPYALSVLLAAVNPDDLRATVAHIVADHLACLAIALPLLLEELIGRRPAASGALPTGELVVAPLRVAMAIAVHTVDADPLALGAEVLQIVAICRVTWRDQALALRQH